MAEQTCIKDEKVVVIGSGLIGGSWAMLFAAAGYSVKLYDISNDIIQKALDGIQTKLSDMEQKGILRGTLTAKQQFERISGSNSLKDAVAGAKFIQECVPENLELKIKVFAELDGLVTDNDVVLSSSTSSMPASSFTNKLVHRSQTIVSHPVNPPFFCPLTEIVPAPYTTPTITETTMAIMKEIGQVPVLLKKELEGFVLNRLQYALLMECWRLIEDDAISPEDLDKAMSEGLGMRYAFIGPLETCHLNAEGMKNYTDRYAEMIHHIVSTFGANPKMDGPALDTIVSSLNNKVPQDKLAERRIWRDDQLVALAQLKKNMANKKD